MNPNTMGWFGTSQCTLMLVVILMITSFFYFGFAAKLRMARDRRREDRKIESHRTNFECPKDGRDQK